MSLKCEYVNSCIHMNYYDMLSSICWSECGCLNKVFRGWDVNVLVMDVCWFIYIHIWMFYYLIASYRLILKCKVVASHLVLCEYVIRLKT